MKVTYKKNDLVLPIIGNGIFSSNSLKIGVKSDKFSMKTDSNETMSDNKIFLAG